MKIYDAKKIIPGVVIFLALLTSPVWYNHVKGESAQVPQLTLPTNSTQCIEPTQWMLDHHMELLNSWRNSVVRDNVQTYTASDGKQYTMSFDTCAECHTNFSDFCDVCHKALGVNPSCWECHIEPGEQSSADK